jgi:gliding motility-associated-like protein
MKKIALLLFVFVSATSMHSQTESSLFYAVSADRFSEIELDSIDYYSILQLNETEWYDILENHPSAFSLEIPHLGELLKLDLTITKLFQDGFTISTSSGAEMIYDEVSKSVFYHGSFEGHPNSHFALSILNNEVIGVGSIPGLGDFNLGQLPLEPEYIFYSEKALHGNNNFVCETRGEATPYRRTPVREGRGLVEDCTSIYFEVDYDLYLDKGGVIETVDYMTALFNEIQLLFEIDGMTVYMSDIKVWDEESPYYGIGDTGVLLDLFGTTTVDWEGDLGHLVTISAGGGLAYVDVFCNPNQAVRKAVSGISTTFAAIPIYSWSVEVISHELGHNMGSPHTHACFWNGDMTAIDGCGPEADYDEGCDGPLPDEGGTVMSYCHLTDVGINLGLGFGEQPGEHIRNTILEAECLMSCDLTVMDMAVTDGILSATCENGPIEREIIVSNNSNDNFTSAILKVYLEGALVETIVWTGFIAEGEIGSIDLPIISLPLGSYTMQIVLESPSGYEDDDHSDNTFTFSFDVTPYPEAEFKPNPDRLVSYNATTTMYNTSIGANSYVWDMDDGTADITAFSPEHTFPFEYGGIYDVTLIATSQFGCSDTVSAPVFVEGVNIYFIENTFTPDGNSFNDLFQPTFSAGLDIYDYHFVIYNRWGEVMFESYNVAHGWNGTYGDSRLAESGVYIWKLEFGDLNSDEKHVKQGHVTLLR